jgi:hypothetical protein
MTPIKSTTPAPKKAPSSRGTATSGKTEALREAGAAILTAKADPTVKPAKAAVAPTKPPAGKTSAAKMAAVETPAAKPPAKSAVSGTRVTAEQRRGMICEAAYYQAERRGFSGGDPLQDWIAAEAEVDRMLSGPSH